MHKRFVLLAIVAAMLLAAPFAFAETATGIVAGFDEDGTVLVLEDGSRFAVTEDFDLSGLEAGSEVVIEYDIDGDQNVLNDLTLAE